VKLFKCKKYVKRELNVSDITLFRFGPSGAIELPGKSALIEKHLQSLLEMHLETFLGVRFLATEYSTGKTHKGRIDSLGLDENNCPVIIEYKRHANETVINQGLFYLDWLLDHKAEFRWLVMEKLGKDIADKIEWSGTRLLCIAADFTKYDQHAVAQINRSIELIRYKLFGEDLMLLELVNAVSVQENDVLDQGAALPDSIKAVTAKHEYSFSENLVLASPELRAIYEQVRSFILARGDDVNEKPLKLYAAFKRLRNFACLTVLPKQDPHVRIWLKLNPNTVELQQGFTRDVSNLGHWGTGDLEVTIRTTADYDKACALIDRSYQEN
jgi:predicted transport protein